MFYSVCSCQLSVVKFFVVQLLICAWLFVTPWTVAHQAPLSATVSWSLLKFMSIESVVLSNHLICHPLLFLPSIFPSFRVFSNELVLQARLPKYWIFNLRISPSNEYSSKIMQVLLMGYIPHTYFHLGLWSNLLNKW